MNLALDLDTVMTVMTVRFALVVAGAAVLLIIAFTITIVLKRNGTLGTVKDQVAPSPAPWANAVAPPTRATAAVPA